MEPAACSALTEDYLTFDPVNSACLVYQILHLLEKKNIKIIRSIMIIDLMVLKGLIN